MTFLGDFRATTLTGEDQALADYVGQAVLVVNTASKCGLTPQYAGLETLYETYRDQGFTVLGFPCNQFGGQEPGSEAEIGAFCEQNYGVGFPMFAKVDVNGDGADPLFAWLRAEKGGEPIEWNFAKFLIGRDGAVIERYAPTVVPDDLAGDVEKAIAG